MIIEDKFLPSHPYSSASLAAAVDAAKANGTSTFNHPGDNLPPLTISIGSNDVVMVESTIPLAQYLPFIQNPRGGNLIGGLHDIEPILFDVKKTSLFELCCTEILHDEFIVRDKTTGQQHAAIFGDTSNQFYVDGLNTLYDGFISLQERFDITVNEPTLANVAYADEPMTDERFWGMVEQCEWKKDFDFNRIKTFLQTNFDDATLKQFSKVMRSKDHELYTITKQSRLFDDIDRNDRLTDCVSHIIGSGKQAFEKCTTDHAFFLKFANSGAYKESFSFAIPSIRQAPYYPYPVDNDKDIKSEITIKARAAGFINELNNIDFDSIYPKDHEKVLNQKEQAMYRAQQVLNGNYTSAYQDFDSKSYSAISSIKGTSFSAGMANLISDVMKRDGFNFKTVEWIDGKPTTPVARVPSKKSPDSLELS